MANFSGKLAGINIGIGVDLTNFKMGLGKVKGDLAKFQKTLMHIKVEGLIKGNPFSTLNNFMEKNRHQLNKMTKSWVGSVSSFEGKLTAHAERIGKKVEGMVGQYERLNKKIKEYKEIGGKLSKIETMMTPAKLVEGWRTGKAEEWASLVEGVYGKKAPEISKRAWDVAAKYRRLVPEGQELTDEEVLGYQKKVMKEGIPDLDKVLSKLATDMKKVREEGKIDIEGMDEALEEWTQLGEKIRKTLEYLEKFEGKAKVAVARAFRKDKDQTGLVAMKEYHDEQAKLITQEGILLAKRREGKDVDRTREALLANYNRQFELTGKLTKEQARQEQVLLNERKKQAQVYGPETDRAKVAAMQEVTAVQAKLIKDEGRLLAKYQMGIQTGRTRSALLENLNQQLEYNGKLTKRQATLQSKLTQEEVSSDTAKKRRDKLNKQLELELKKINAETKAGININKNAARQVAIWRQQLEMGVKTSHRARKAVIDFDKAQEKAKKRGGRAPFLSMDWIKHRARWFAELRLLWGAYRTVGNAARSLIEFQDQLARAMRTARSETRSTIKVTNMYAKAMRDAVAEHGVDWQDAGEALYQLGSAGLTAEEALAALNDTMSLLVGTEGDVREVTKAVAGIYNNFSETLTEYTTKQEKFNHIAAVMATLWKNNQIEISELVNGLKMSSSMAKVAGLSFEFLGATLAVANNHMIKDGRAGRALVNVLSRMARGGRSFARAFNVEKLFDIDEPIKFVEIMRVLHRRLKDNTLSAGQLNETFTRLGIRGAPAFATIVQYLDEIEEQEASVRKNLQTHKELEEVRLNSLAGAWKKFLGTMKSAIASAKPMLEFLEGILNQWSDFFNKTRMSSIVNAILAGEIEAKSITDKQIALLEGETKRLKASIETQKKDLDEAVKAYAKDQSERAADESSDALFNSIGRLYPFGTSYTDMKRVIGGITKHWTGTQIVGMRKGIEADTKTYNDYTNAIKLATKAKIDADIEMSAKKWAYEAPLQKGGYKNTAAMEAEKEAKSRMGLVTIDGEIAKNRKRISDIDKDIATYMADIADMRAKEREDGKHRDIEINKNWEDVLKLLDKKEKKESNIQRLEKEEQKILKEMKDSRDSIYDSYVTEWQEQNKGYDLEIKRLKTEKDMLEKKGVTADEAERIYQINSQIAALQEEIARWEYQIVALHGQYGKATLLQVKNAEKNLALKKQSAEAEKKAADEANKNARRSTEIRERTAALQSKILDLEYNVQQLKFARASRASIIQAEREMLYIRIEELELTKSGLKDKVEIARINNKIRNYQLDITKSLEDERRAVNGIYDAWCRIRDSVQDIQQLTSDLIVKFVEDFGAGLSDVFTQATGGFQEQQQEVVDLEAELQELAYEYDEAIGEGNAEKANEIAERMAEIRNNIEDLEDPIHNLKEAFREFFKDVIDGIREMIIKWLVAQAIMKIGSMMMGGSANTMGADAKAGYFYKEGGVTPSSIKSFTKFSRGGITGSPTLALLGDNPSKKELVIPSENIQKDRVSGYARDRGEEQPINVINVITENDFAQTMGKPMGGKVIVNRVLQDLDETGPIARRLQVA